MLVAAESEGDCVRDTVVRLNDDDEEDEEEEEQDDEMHDEMQENVPLLLCDSWKGLITGVDQEFKGGRDELRQALSKYSIVHGFEYRFVKNDRKIITVECAHKVDMSCLWRLHASADVDGQFFYTRTYTGVHTCGIGFMHRSSKRMSSSLVATEIADKISKSPLTRPTDIVKEFCRKYACDINYMTAFRGVQNARGEFFGNYRVSYDQLRIHMERALEFNPGSHMVIEKDEPSKRFLRCFIAYHASIVGFNFCRPMIFLDATFLTGTYKRQLLLATTKDGNNSLYPIATAIVDIEDEANWTWFMHQLRLILKEDRVIVFASDRHKGLLEAVSAVFPDHPHSFCIIHLKNNMKTKMGSKPPEVRKSFLKKFNHVAYSYTKSRFKRKYDELKLSAGKYIGDWLDTIDPRHYAHSHFPGKRYTEMTSNSAESMNAKYKKLRMLPVIGLIDGILVKLMKDTTNKREKSARWTDGFCPRIVKKIKTATTFGSTWTVRKASDFVYEVLAKKSVLVDLSNMTCSCHSWQINGLPCAHAFTAIHRSGLPLNQFIDPFYYTETNRMVYDLSIIPIDTLEIPLVDANNLQIMPPNCKRQPGRPKKKRGEGADDDKKRSYQCSRCKKYGHNCRNCNQVIES